MLSMSGAKAHPAFLTGGGKLGALIKAHRWADTPLADPESWPQSLRSALSICLHSNFPTAIYWGPELRLLYNDAWAPIPAERHPWALGRPAAEVWADIWDVIGPQFARVLESGEGFSTYDQMLPMLRQGVRRETYWNYSFTAIRGEDGSVVGVFNQGNETTGAVLARRQAEAEIARLGRMFAQAPGAVAILRGPSHQFEIVNPACEALVGRRDLVGRTVGEALPEVIAQGFGELLDRVLAEGEPHVGRAVPVTLLRSPGAPAERRFIDFVFHPLIDAAGAGSGIFVQAMDVTDAARSEAALRENEEFSRSVVESSGDCIKVIELDGSLSFMNENGRCLMEIDDLASVCGKPWVDLWPEETRAEVAAAMQAALRGETGRFSAFCPTAKGTPSWWDVVVTAVRSSDGLPLRLVSISRDVTEQHRAEEARQLLLNEMNHRVKNLFAVASSMVTMTARAAGSVDEMSEALRGRLNALAKAHDLIRTAVVGEVRPDQDASLRPLIEAIIEPHTVGNPDRRIVLEGPQVGLSDRSVTSFALIFHELATNAAKYGALCSPDGRLSVRWEVSDGHLRLDWSEALQDAVVQPPVSQGFGSKLAHISATVQLGGSIDFDWRPHGVRIALVVPQEQLRL